MSTKTAEIAKMIDMLPDSDKELAYELIKKLVLAWDPDYTKVTEQEYIKILQKRKTVTLFPKTILIGIIFQDMQTK